MMDSDLLGTGGDGADSVAIAVVVIELRPRSGGELGCCGIG